jgi:EAL domain-containing protein (putative c-di-GMP-specific phosphodiesterase class I)/ActR/RegA family two-component response regulator
MAAGATGSKGSGSAGRALVVDDEPAILRVIERVLSARGYAVECCTDGVEAIRRLEAAGFDTIISDISMPGIGGIELLRRVREHDLDVPVILITGAPAIGTAVKAVEYGAFRYLTKPFDLEELVDVVSRAVRLHRFARIKREAIELLGLQEKLVGDRAGLEATFENALESLWIAYQPILRSDDGGVFGYEALMRTDEPSLPHPGAVLDAAERLGRLLDLGRKIRERAGAPIAQAPDDALIFVNLHPNDLSDPELRSKAGSLAPVAGRIVLEITERAPLDKVNDVARNVASLREMGFRIALDDMGAGYAGLTSFSLLEPEIVKLDMALIRDVDSNPTRRRLVESMTALCKDLAIKVVAEGVETAAERDTLAELGCELQQGFLFARPAEAFPDVTW